MQWVFLLWLWVLLHRAFWVANLTDFTLSWHTCELHAYYISISNIRNKFAPSLNSEPPQWRLKGRALGILSQDSRRRWMSCFTFRPCYHCQSAAICNWLGGYLGPSTRPQIKARFSDRPVTNLVVILTDIGLLDLFKWQKFESGTLFLGIG